MAAMSRSVSRAGERDHVGRIDAGFVLVRGACPRQGAIHPSPPLEH